MASSHHQMHYVRSTSQSSQGQALSETNFMALTISEPSFTEGGKEKTKRSKYIIKI